MSDKNKEKETITKKYITLVIDKISEQFEITKDKAILILKKGIDEISQKESHYNKNEILFLYSLFLIFAIGLFFFLLLFFSCLDH